MVRFDLRSPHGSTGPIKYRSVCVCPPCRPPAVAPTNNLTAEQLQAVSGRVFQVPGFRAAGVSGGSRSWACAKKGASTRRMQHPAELVPIPTDPYRSLKAPWKLWKVVAFWENPENFGKRLAKIQQNSGKTCENLGRKFKIQNIAKNWRTFWD